MVVQGFPAFGLSRRLSNHLGMAVFSKLSWPVSFCFCLLFLAFSVTYSHAELWALNN